MKFASSIVAQFIKDIAEGKYGDKAKDIYWSLAGKKRIIALAIAGFWGICQVALHLFSQCGPECMSPQSLAQLEGYVATVPYIVAFLISVGLYDAAVRLEPPKKQ